MFAALHLEQRVRKLLIGIACVLCASVSAEILYTKGGECVAYARAQMVALGFNAYTQMPGLCQFDNSETCGAYLIYQHWDLGFGKGAQPGPQSLMVIGRDTGVSVGHVAVVQQVSDNGDGTKTLVGTDSNAKGDQMIYTDVHWVFDPANMRASREGGPWHPVLGFVYSRANSTTNAGTTTDAIISQCLWRFAGYFGNRQGAAYDSGEFRYQLTTGGSLGAVRAIAVQLRITPLVVWYYWDGWRTLDLRACY
ncbi:MAG: CHAP domain-containing protein [Pseudomonadota bacterium]